MTLFDYAPATWEAIIRNAPLLAHIAKERIKEELTKAFQNGDPFNWMVLIETAGLLPQLFPALAATRHVDQPVRYHAFDVYTHTLLTLHALQRLNADYLVRFAMLYHDVGKVAQYAAYTAAKGDKEKIRETIAGPLNHRVSSPVLMKADFKALGFSNKEIDTIARYIAKHHTPGEILNAHPANREKKLRILLSEKGFEMVDNLLDINIADRQGQFNPLQSTGDLRESYELKRLLRKLQQEEGQFRKQDLLITGNDLIQHYGMQPGKKIGALLEAVFQRVLGDIQTRNTPKQLDVFIQNRLKNKAQESS